MQPLKISRPLSKSSRPKRKLLWLGSALVVVLIIALLTPILIRTNREAITREITTISQQESGKQELAYRELLSATGGDQAVARALAEYYSAHNLHKKAAETYEHAHGGLLLDAAREYALALDYTNVARVARTSTNNKPTAESLAWQGIALLNQKDTDKGCEKARESEAKSTTAPLAQQVKTACEYMRRNQADPWKLTEAGLLAVASEKIQGTAQPSSAALVLLARLQQQSGESDKALQSLSRALVQTPFDREVLTAVTSLCSQSVTPSDCSTLQKAAGANLELLPPR
jgi:tetratricopeptide (TPR) repeat protein